MSGSGIPLGGIVGRHGADAGQPARRRNSGGPPVTECCVGPVQVQSTDSPEIDLGVCSTSGKSAT